MEQSAAAPAPTNSTSTTANAEAMSSSTKSKVVLPETYCSHYVEFNEAGKPHGLSFDFRNASGRLQVLHAAMFEDGVQVRKYDRSERHDAVVLYFRARKQARPAN